MEDFNITTGDLATVVGAGAAALIVAQFCKTLFNLNAAWTRSIAMLTGLTVVVIATATTRGFANPVEFILAVIVGMQAGLSASAGFDISRAGIDHVVQKKSG